VTPEEVLKSQLDMACPPAGFELIFALEAAGYSIVETEWLQQAARTIETGWEAYLEGSPELLDDFERQYHRLSRLSLRGDDECRTT